MTNSITAIKPERLAQYAKDFNADRANLVAANAAVSSGVLEAATDYKGQRALPRDFSIELKQGSITNQRRSGRCWMFASLNTLRYELMHQWGLDDFEFSETYLFFWDAMEKSNTYLENVFATLDEPTDSPCRQVWSRAEERLPGIRQFQGLRRVQTIPQQQAAPVRRRPARTLRSRRHGR